jgi:hypothetical protein
MARTEGTGVHHHTQLKLYLLQQEIFNAFYNKDYNIWTTQGLFPLKYGLDFSFPEFI